MKKLSLVMIVKNEERCLKRCLESAIPYVDEIVIVDTGSTDKTIEIAEKFSAKIFRYDWNSNFAQARNFAIEQSTGDFNLILDADEYIINMNKENVQKYMNNNKFIGQIKLVNLFESDGVFKKEICHLSRIAPKNIFFEGSIHEQLSSKMPRIFVDIEVEHDGYLIDNDNKFDRNIKIILSELEKNPNNNYMNYQAAQTYFVNKEFDKASRYFDKYIDIADFNKDAYYKNVIINAIYNSIKIEDYEKYLNVIEYNLDILNKECDFWFTCGVFFTNLLAFNTEKYIGLMDNISICYMNALEIGEGDTFIGVVGTGTFLPAQNLCNYYDVLGDKENAEKYRRLYEELSIDNK